MTAQLTAPAGAEFVERMRLLHVRRGDGWCACGFPHCGIRVLLDHLDHAEARIADALTLLAPGAIGGTGTAFTPEEDIAHFNAVRAALQDPAPNRKPA